MIPCQVGAALRPAFTPETPPDITAKACQVSGYRVKAEETSLEARHLGVQSQPGLHTELTVSQAGISAHLGTALLHTRNCLVSQSVGVPVTRIVCIDGLVRVSSVSITDTATIVCGGVPL